MDASERKERVVVEAEEVQKTVARMAHEVLEKNSAVEDLILIGIRSRGAHLVARMGKKIEELAGVAPVVSAVDITPFRDDLAGGRSDPQGAMEAGAIAVDEKVVVLVDDVAHTGRTMRAALALVRSLGSPKRILVAVMVDRGDRQLPLRADIVGKNVHAAASEKVRVLLRESDGIDRVVVASRTQDGMGKT